MKTALFITLALVIAICVVPVWCQGRPGGPGGPGGHGGPGGPGPMMGVPPPPPAMAIDGITKTLGLTADQAAALSVILTADETKIRPLIEAACESDKALHEAFKAGDFETAKNLADEVTTDRAEVVKACIAAWAEIKASGVLTDDQFSKLLAGPGQGGPRQGNPPPGQNNGNRNSRGGRR